VTGYVLVPWLPIIFIVSQTKPLPLSQEDLLPYCCFILQICLRLFALLFVLCYAIEDSFLNNLFLLNFLQSVLEYVFDIVGLLRWLEGKG
jgi:hypothetical protein